MTYLLNALYLGALAVLSPWLLVKALTTGKYRRGLGPKLCGTPASAFRPKQAPRVWFHGVSVGEIHLLRTVVAAFRRHHPDWDCVISTTTDTGHDEARKAFPDLVVFWWPFDCSWAVRRTLRAVQPDLVILAEGEIWPNSVCLARQQGIPVAIVNGRLSPRSAARYQWLAPLVRPLFAQLDLIAMQTEQYAAYVRALGAVPERIVVTGNIKFDGVTLERANPKTQALAQLLHIQPGDLVWIAGSTQAPEEQLTLDLYRQLQAEFPRLRLCLVPRQRDRFEEVAGLLARSGLLYVRRSSLTGQTTPADLRSAVLLVDTIGELGALWGLADVAFVGGSLDGRRGGQNMIEPAAYGAAVVFGPHVWNFRETAAQLVDAGAAVQIEDAAGLAATIRRLLADAEERHRLGTAAQRFVRTQQGATERTLACLEPLLLRPNQSGQAA